MFFVKENSIRGYHLGWPPPTVTKLMNDNHLPLPHCFTTEFHYPPQFKGFSMNGGSVEMISSDEITQCTPSSRLIVIASLCPLCPTGTHALFSRVAFSSWSQRLCASVWGSSSERGGGELFYFIFRIVNNYFYVVHLAVAVFFEYWKI